MRMGGRGVSVTGMRYTIVLTVNVYSLWTDFREDKPAKHAVPPLLKMGVCLSPSVIQFDCEAGKKPV